MPEEGPVPIGEPIEQALLRLLRPDLLQLFRDERERHKQEKQQIETARKRAQALLWRCFRSPLREKKEAELERKYVERVQGEVDRHNRFLQELRETIRDHWDTWPEEP